MMVVVVVTVVEMLHLQEVVPIARQTLWVLGLDSILTGLSPL